MLGVGHALDASYVLFMPRTSVSHGLYGSHVWLAGSHTGHTRDLLTCKRSLLGLIRVKRVALYYAVDS